MSVTAKASDFLRVECKDCPIRHRAVCSRCTADEIEELNAFKFYKSYSAGQTIAASGDELEALSSVVLGVASLSATFEDGRVQTVGLLLPSDFIGRPGRATVMHDITAVTEVTLCSFHRRDFERFMLKSPHICSRLLEMTHDELDAARNWMTVLGRKTAREKVATLLATLLHRSHLPDELVAAGPKTLFLPLSREAIADFVGLTVETVSRQFTALRKDGVIRLDGKRRVIVPDVERLEAEAAL